VISSFCLVNEEPRGKPRGIFVGEEIYYTLPRASGFLGPYPVRFKPSCKVLEL